MQISVAKRKEYAEGFIPTNVGSMEEIAQIATKKSSSWSCGIYRGNYRNLDNFVDCNFIGLDIDGGMTLEDAKERFKKYKHCIVTSKSHLKEKNGVTADRFRVVLQLSEKIENKDYFYSTWFDLEGEFPAIDPACKDPSRMWWTGGEIIQIQEEGSLVQVSKRVPEPPKYEEAEGSDYGKLSYLTLDFLTNGAPDGSWTGRLFKAAKDLQQQGYSRDEAVEKLKMATVKYLGNLDGHDLKQIDGAYKKANKYAKRAGAFNWENVDELSESEEINWLVHDLIALGGLGVIAGKPGLGKSTIIRQLAKCVCQGASFLGRPVQKGGVLHIALEESRQIFQKEATIQGLKDEPQYYVHISGVNIMDNIEELERSIIDKKAKLLIIDSLIRAAGDLDTNSQGDMTKFLKVLQDLADRAMVTIILVHHQNKSGAGQDSVAGSYAITASGDMVMTFEGEGKRRFLNTTKLRGGKPWFNFSIEYDEKTRWYKAGSHQATPISKEGYGDRSSW